MKKRIVRYIKHVVVTFVLLGTFGIGFGLYHGASLNYSENPIMMNWDKDGPYVFFNNDRTLTVNYIRGNQEDGFYLEREAYNMTATIPVRCHFPLDHTNFELNINTAIDIPKSTYNDNQKIIAISDIESNFKTFRDFLVHNKVIDKQLNWIFGNGHLVLLGDFVDRGFSTTQVLWFIYKLEQDAKRKGGTVHFILGNHEVKNLQGNFESTSPKYVHVSAILGKQQTELYSQHSFLGQWITTKNTIELINGILFTHGGIHPGIAQYDLTLDEVNQIVRANYYMPYYPKKERTIEQLLISSHRGIAWYRGYFREDLTQEEVARGLKMFGAKMIVVGHTLQSRIKKYYNGKVIGIDVKHPKDYSKSFPNYLSEGLLIENEKHYRLFHDGEKKEI